MLLAIDTSHGTSIAVVDRDGGILAEVSDQEANPVFTKIGEAIAAVLASSGINPTALSGVALGTGPGPEDRIAVGYAAAYAFAAALGKPVVRVLSHDAVALGRAESTLVVSDTGDGVVWTSYGPADAELGLPTRITDPVAAAAAPGEAEDASIVPVDVVSAGDLGMLAERLYAGGRQFARREPYTFESLPAAQP